MTFLLDVNVLIALLDPAHVNHDPAHAWFEAMDCGPKGPDHWATCPITENGVIRILGHSKYPNTPGSPAVVAAMMRQVVALPGRIFWADKISLLVSEHSDIDKILTPRQVTDSYLLTLAAAYGGKLATFDRRLSVAATVGGRAALHVIEVGK